MVRIGNKVVSLNEAAGLVPSGAHVTFGGFGHSLAPMALVRELIRLGRTSFELSSVAEAWPADLLAGADAIARVRMSNFMFEGLGRCRNFSRQVESGAIAVEDYSHFAMAARLHAGASGLPFTAIRSVAGSDIEMVTTFDAPKTVRFTEPFSSDKVLLLPALRPDYALLHASRADEEGNLQLFGASSVVADQAMAARHVIVTVEEIVTSRELRRDPQATIVPGFFVDAVAVVPYGAHPTGMYLYYDPDFEHISHYYEASRSAATFREYLRRYVYDPTDHWAYLNAIGGIGRLLALRPDPAFGYRRPMH